MEIGNTKSSGRENQPDLQMMLPDFYEPHTDTGGGSGVLYNGGVAGHYWTNSFSNLMPNSAPHYYDELQSPWMRSSPSSMAAMREMIFHIAAMQPINIDPEAVKPPKRKNVRISKDPQSVAARHRRERISERIRILQRLVPGGTKMDTASMLDEAIHYVKFLKRQVQSLEKVGPSHGHGGLGLGFAMPAGEGTLGYNNYQSGHFLETGGMAFQRGQASSSDSYGEGDY